MKYPNIIFFRYSKFSDIDAFFNKNSDNLLCNLNITNDKNDLNKLFDPSYPLLITFGDNQVEYYNDVYSIIAERMTKRWIHMTEINDIHQFNNSVNFCFIHNVTLSESITQVVFSIFTIKSSLLIERSSK
jgi:hypothetical protein